MRPSKFPAGAQLPNESPRLALAWYPIAGSYVGPNGWTPPAGACVHWIRDRYNDSRAPCGFPLAGCSWENFSNLLVVLELLDCEDCLGALAAHLLQLDRS